MLSQAEAEKSNIKTLTLARANLSDVSSPGPGFLTAAARSASGKSSIHGQDSADNVSALCLNLFWASENFTLTVLLQNSSSSESARLLSKIGVVEFLEQDPRPTFILNHLDKLYHPVAEFDIVYANLSLRSTPLLLDVIQNGPEDGTQTDLDRFHKWSTVPQSELETPDIDPVYMFAGIKWARSTLRGRVRLVSAMSNIGSMSIAQSSASSPKFTSKEYFERRHFLSASTGLENGAGAGVADPSPKRDIHNKMQSPQPISPSSDMETGSPMQAILTGIPAQVPNEPGFFDWTTIPLTDDLPRHIKFARSIDWGSTSLGPIEFWPSDLRQMCNLMMASPHPAAMYWSSDLVAIYNEAYVLLAGQKHPKLMGSRYCDAWSEIWEEVKDAFANALETGQATMKDDDMLFINRSNYVEEAYFSWCLIPIVGGNGSVCGLYNPAFEKTRRKVAERRMLTLREVGEHTALAKDMKKFWQAVKHALAINESDTPFAMLYSVGDENDSDTASSYSTSVLGGKTCSLEASLGVPDDHPSAPQAIDLKTGTEGFGPIFREVIKAGRSLLLRVTGDSILDGSPGSAFSGGSSAIIEDPEDFIGDASLEISDTMLEGFEWRGFKDPCRAVVVCPVSVTAGDSILGFLIVGVNPRRPYDEDYSLFIQLLTRQLATSLASVVLYEEEVKRGERAAAMAALDRIKLSEQLAIRTQEAREIEKRFFHMAKYSPAGLFTANGEGQITYCNNKFYEISGVPKDKVDNWVEYVRESEKDMVSERWNGLMDKGEPITFEFRFATPSKDSRDDQPDTWVLFSAHPEKSDELDTGQLKTIFGSITDISVQKWAQSFQKRKTEEAVELKRQQEEFIDITSHEMRNPLSAILQCADQITTSLSDVKLPDLFDREHIMSSIDAAETIVECAQHQKRIVDDILTLSKLDSHMLIVSPIDVQPLIVLQRAMRMFESETKKGGIEMKLVVDPSFEKLEVDWARLDPQRVGQVLINLMTNAIKFTANAQKKRYIEVGLSASKDRPSTKDNPLVQYFPARSPPDKALLRQDELDQGDVFYLEYSVQDTGTGLWDEEKKKLFNKFTQANHRTHVHYGGSGLGLFISRELAELQGGQIGVSSEVGVGSTFAFYVKSCTSVRPENPDLAFSADFKNDPKDRTISNQFADPMSDASPAEPNKAATKARLQQISLLIVEVCQTKLFFTIVFTNKTTHRTTL